MLSLNPQSRQIHPPKLEICDSVALITMSDRPVAIRKKKLFVLFRVLNILLANQEIDGQRNN